ncbi:MAG: amidohydrolase [Sphingomonadales bacterium]|nr:MAG: amidohydrolase [Sphingomonadales bacterium]TNF03753.1 MAG: amidohydrolase [Sphingomonadales bacterium]
MAALTRPLFAALLLSLMSSPAAADEIGDRVRADMPSLLDLYRDLHRHPELSNKEMRTSALLAKEMRQLGFTVTTGVGGTGLVAMMENGPGPVVLLRTDMDGLPVTEATGLPYASMEPGVMHACGHDIHMTSWIGTARRLAAMKGQWSGTLMMIAQPAEEVGRGAKAMIEDGLFTRFPKPAAAIALHDAADLPAGTIGYAPGYTFANVDSVDIVVKGIGGHGAYPQNTKDPVVLAARIVTALQTITAREIDPQDAAVVTVGHIFGGTKRNVIPDEVTLELTVRSYAAETRQKVLDAIARIARGEAIAAGMPEDRMPIVRQGETYTPAAFNTEPLTGRIIALFEQRFGDRVQRKTPTMGGEDFGRYRTGAGSPDIPSLIFWLGAVPQAQWDAAGGDVTKLPSLHSAHWAPDPEPTIAAGVEALTAAALDLLKNP